MKKHIKYIFIILFIIILFSSCQEGSETFYPSWGKVYIPNFVGGEGNTVTIINGRTNGQKVIDLGVREDGEAGGKGSIGVGANSSTNKVYVSNYQDDTVSVIDGTLDTRIKVIKNVGKPHNIAVNPRTNRIYVIDFTGNKITIIDGHSDLELTTIPTEVQSYSIAINTQTNTIYAANPGDNSFTVINGRTNGFTNYRSAGLSNPRGVTVNPLTNKVYISSRDSNTVTVIDGKTNAKLSVIYGFSEPIGIAVNSETNKIYVANYNSSTGNRVTVIDGATDKVINVITGISGAWSVAVNEITNKIFVTNIHSALSVIDGESGEVNTISDLNDPVFIAFLP